MKLLLGAPVRQKEHIFIEYLDRLRKLIIPEGVEVHKHFIFNNCDYSHMLQENETCEIYETKDTYITDNDTHHWQATNFSNVIIMKNKLLAKTVKEDYDYFMLVDSDLLLHPNTLEQLLQEPKHIKANVFYTKWKEDDVEYMPNAWDLDHYSFKSKASLSRLFVRGLHQVGYSGACILIHRNVIRAGVNYSPIPVISFSVWEDRAFCIKANLAGYDVWLDTHYPAEHIYRESDYEKLKDVYR